jgi:hypothetical protein
MVGMVSVVVSYFFEGIVYSELSMCVGLVMVIVLPSHFYLGIIYSCACVCGWLL